MHNSEALINDSTTTSKILCCLKSKFKLFEGLGVGEGGIVGDGGEHWPK